MAYQMLSQSTGLAMENAMHAEGNMQQIANAATGTICSMIVKAGTS